MAVGKSNRIVVEIEPDLKEQVYVALKTKGLTFKEWLTEKILSDLLRPQTQEQFQKPEGRRE